MPRPRPTRTNPAQSETIGAAEPKSRQKAESARKRTDALTPIAPDGWPVNENGRPLAKITLTAAELIPNGQFANVSVGPAQITTFIDPDRVLGDDESYFSDDEMETYAAAMNQLAEVVEIDVVGVQRNLVMESIQEQIGNGNGS